MQTAPSFRAAAEAAMRRTMVVGAVASIVVGILLGIASAVATGVLVGLLVAVAVMVVASSAWVTHVQRNFAGVVSRVVEGLGREAGPDEQPAMLNALEGVAILTGVAVPGLRVLDSQAANAMVASDGERSVVVVTSGLLREFRPVESEAIAAELLCRVRDGSARYCTLAVGLPALLRRVGGFDGTNLAGLLGEQRAVHADAEAVAITRYPPGLICVFERMIDAGTRVDGVDPATAPLWIAPAVGAEGGVAESLDRTVNQPLEYRMAVMLER